MAAGTREKSISTSDQEKAEETKNEAATAATKRRQQDVAEPATKRKQKEQ